MCEQHDGVPKENASVGIQATIDAEGAPKSPANKQINWPVKLKRDNR